MNPVQWTDIRKVSDARMNDILHLKDGSSMRVTAIDVDISGGPGLPYVQWTLYIGQDEHGDRRQVNELSVCDVARM